MFYIQNETIGLIKIIFVVIYLKIRPIENRR